VPGEGVEPSRAEAHGFLRPARLPIPPSRPGGSRVAARGLPPGPTGLLLLLALLAVACTEAVSPPGGATPTIAFLFDGSTADAELVTSPALAGLELAAKEAGGIEIEPVNIGLDHDEVTASLRSLGEDRGVVAAVIAPWTAPPLGAIELLGANGIPVVTLSWAWGPSADGNDSWLSFVAGRATEAVILLSEAARTVPEGASLCLAGDGHVTSGALLETAEQLGEAAGDPGLVMVGIAESGTEGTAGGIGARVRDAGCPVLVWTGGAEMAALVMGSISDPPSMIGTSRMKTDGALEIAASGIELFTICACADVTLSTEARWQRFVHDLQAESGAPPGPFAVEAYDAGRLLIGSLEGSDGSRRGLASALDGLTGFTGLAGAYAFESDGSRASGSLEVGIWRAAGSRWLPRSA
jgi:Periplasmic binding protein